MSASGVLGSVERLDLRSRSQCGRLGQTSPFPALYVPSLPTTRSYVPVPRTSAAGVAAHGTSPPLHSRWLQAQIGQPHEVLRVEQAGNGNIFVDCLPVEADASPNQPPIRPLPRRGIQQSWKPSQRRRHLTTVR